MIAAIASLLLCQLAGEIVVRALSLPLPGPVAGLGFLFLALVWHGRRNGRGDGQGRGDEPAVPLALGKVADMLLRHLSLLFIPAAVGVVQYFGLLRTYAGPIAVAVLVSTTLTLVLTALTFRLVSRLQAFRHAPAGETIKRAIDDRHHP